MAILLTGANGFVGTNYINSLEPFNESVVAVDIVPPKERVPCSLPVTHELVDLTNYDSTLRLIDLYGFNAIIHLAGISQVGNERALDVNVSMARNLLKAVRHLYTNHPPKMIFAGSAAEYGDLKHDEPPATESSRFNPTEPYAASKAIISRMANVYRLHTNIPITVLRFANIYGPRQEASKLIPNLIKASFHGMPIRLNAFGTPTRQWLYIDDAIDAINVALEASTHQIFNIGNPEEISIKDLAEMIITFMHDAMLNNSEFILPSAIELTDGWGGPQRIAMDVSEAERVLAFSPLVSLRQGIERTVRAYVEGMHESRKSGIDPGCVDLDPIHLRGPQRQVPRIAPSK